MLAMKGRKTKEPTPAEAEAEFLESVEDGLVQAKRAAYSGIVMPYRRLVRKAAGRERLTQGEVIEAASHLEQFGLEPSEFLRDVEVFRYGARGQADLADSGAKIDALCETLELETRNLKRLQEETNAARGRYNNARSELDSIKAVKRQVQAVTAANPRLFAEPAQAVEFGICDPAQTWLEIECGTCRQSGKR